MIQISPPQSVRPRVIWPHEARDFTPWLAENLFFLAEPLNMELEFEAREKSIGEFRADIVCRNKADDSRIVIENQLGKSDHSHLGQVLTYAAGLQAATIVWLTTEFREAHRVTLDWHNEITSAPFKFFGVAINTWKDEESRYMAKLNVVAKPNNWTTTGDAIPYQVRV